MTSCNDNINDRTLYAMYSSDMQKAYPSTLQGHIGLSTVLSGRRQGGEKGKARNSRVPGDKTGSKRSAGKETEQGKWKAKDGRRQRRKGRTAVKRCAGSVSKSTI